MNINSRLNVREIQPSDFDLIADYWLKSEPDFLISMGVDLSKLPTREGLKKMLGEQFELPMEEKASYALIWELDGKPLGHSNVNGIEFGKQATMHLHLWNNENRKKGIGSELLKKSLNFYFDKLKLETLFCEPYALNPAPNKTLEKLGFEFVKKYVTIPGSLNFEQEVNRWKLTKEQYLKKEDKYMQFETERLIIKPVNHDDVSFILELLNTKKWLQYIGDRKVKTLEDAQKYIADKMTPQLKRLGYGNYTIIRKLDNEKMGTCGLFDREGLEGIDIGFAFLPQYEKMGYAFESANKIKDEGINRFGIKKLVAITTKENIESQKLIKKLGLQFVKIVNIPNDEEDLLLYELNIA